MVKTTIEHNRDKAVLPIATKKLSNAVKLSIN